MNGYPDNCLRRLRKPDWITPEGHVDSQAYYPERNAEPDPVAHPHETSVNWEDDVEALQVTADQATGAIVGVARLERAAINEAANYARLPGALGYERKPERGNKYHGNILYYVPIKVAKMLAATLALRAKVV